MPLNHFIFNMAAYVNEEIRLILPHVQYLQLVIKDLSYNIHISSH